MASPFPPVDALDAMQQDRRTIKALFARLDLADDDEKVESERAA